MKFITVFLLRIAALGIWHLFSLIVTGALVGSVISLASNNGQDADVFSLFLVSLAETLAVLFLIYSVNLTGIRLVTTVFIIFHSIKTFLMMIEAAFFLNIWTSTPLLSLSQVTALEVHGLLMAGLFCPVAVWLSGKWKQQQSIAVIPSPIAKEYVFAKLIGISCFYALCYMLAGQFILMPLSGDTFHSTYGGLQAPGWLPFFQMARGFMWALLILLMMRFHVASGIRLYASVTVVLTILSTAQLISPNPYMEPGLRYAHIVEIAVSMSIFGWCSAWLLNKNIFTRRNGNAR